MYKIITTLFIIISLIRGEDYYEILGINKSANYNEIRKAFKKLATIYHPDKNINDPDAHDKFIQLTIAYETLKAADSRRKYDLYGKDSLETHTHSSSFNLYENDKYIIILEEDDYFDSVINSDYNWFVNFYSPMCNHCHHLAPIWKEIARLFDGAVKFAVVNCRNDWQLCRQLGIRIYPTLFYFKKDSQNGIYYTGKQTREAITQFSLNGLDVHIPTISVSQWKMFLHGIDTIQTPMLIFICGNQRNCFTIDEKLIIAATFDKVIDVKIFICKDDCHDKVSYNTQAVYLSTYNTYSWEPVFFDNVLDIEMLIEKLLKQLPNPQELTSNDFENIRQDESNAPWLICFYLGNSTSIDMQMKKFVKINMNLGKINCGRSSQLCKTLGINHYPAWGVLKSGGAFELNHGKDTNNDIIKFAQISIKATNVWALSTKEAVSILQRHNENEVWFLDWYTPWCPPCIYFLSELRRASLEFDKSVVRFGTIDCSVHGILCHQYNIQSYPTAMLINGSNTHKFATRKTTANVIQFINERRNPSVIELTARNFHHLMRKKDKIIWIIDYFVPWCEPCQRLIPQWITIAKSLSDLPFINVASVNCEDEASLCTSQGIRFYPNIRMYSLESKESTTVASYNGKQDIISILTWTTTFFPKRVRDLNLSEYREVLISKQTWIVDFYVPQCHYCQKMEPEFAIAAQMLEKVRFGRINCNFYMHECAQANIKAFPTLMLYTQKQKKRENNHDGIRIDAITAKAIRDDILEIINSRTKHDEL